MIYVHIRDGVVVNRAVFDGSMPSEWPNYAEWMHEETAQIGWTYDGTTFTPPPRPAPSPPQTVGEIYDRVMQSDRVLRAVIQALNKGTFLPGLNHSSAQLKSIITPEM